MSFLKKVKQKLTRFWRLIWIISLIICFTVSYLLHLLPIQISNPLHYLLVTVFIYFFVLSSIYGSFFIGIKLLKFNDHDDRLNTTKHCYILLGIVIIAIPLLLISMIWYVGGDIFFRTYINTTQSSSGNNNSQMDAILFFISVEYYQSILFALFVIVIIFFIIGVLLKFLIKSSFFKFKEYSNYIFSGETTEKLIYYYETGKKAASYFLVFFTVIFIALSMLGDLGLEILKIATIFLLAFFFIGLAIYNGFGILLSYKLWEKIQNVFQTSFKTPSKKRRNIGHIKESFFEEIHTQVAVNDSYLWSIIIFSIPLFIWGTVACSVFNLDLNSTLIIISASLLLAIIVPYQYVNYFLKKKSVNYLIKCDLPEYLISLKEVLGFRNTIISIIVPLITAISLILSQM